MDEGVSEGFFRGFNLEATAFTLAWHADHGTGEHVNYGF